MAKKSSCALSVSQTHWRWPYHATAHGTSLIINSFSFIQPAVCWMSGGKYGGKTTGDSLADKSVKIIGKHDSAANTAMTA